MRKPPFSHVTTQQKRNTLSRNSQRQNSQSLYPSINLSISSIHKVLLRVRQKVDPLCLPWNVLHETSEAPVRRRNDQEATCWSCGTTTTNPRNHLCNSCYLRQRRGSPAVFGATCCVCGESDIGLLRALRLAQEVVVVCLNHGHLGERARPQPANTEELVTMVRARGHQRIAAVGERRRAEDRRQA